MEEQTKIDFDGALFVEVFKVFEEMYCCVINRTFRAFKKSRVFEIANSSNKAELALQVSSGFCLLLRSYQDCPIV